MKKICEIYDISKDYSSNDKSLLVLVSDLDKSILQSYFSEKINDDYIVMNESKWSDYIAVDKEFNRNESKHQMRRKNNSVKLEIETSNLYTNDLVAEILENAECGLKIESALSKLNKIAKERFLKHYVDHRTYRQIAEDEGKAVSTIYESIQTARKKFLKNF
jgi:hypothetical protein